MCTCRVKLDVRSVRRSPLGALEKNTLHMFNLNASDDPEVDPCPDPDNFGKGAEAVWSQLGIAVMDRDMSKVWS